jgi:hypothetical protein
LHERLHINRTRLAAIAVAIAFISIVVLWVRLATDGIRQKSNPPSRRSMPRREQMFAPRARGSCQPTRSSGLSPRRPNQNRCSPPILTDRIFRTVSGFRTRFVCQARGKRGGRTSRNERGRQLRRPYFPLGDSRVTSRSSCQSSTSLPSIMRSALWIAASSLSHLSTAGGLRMWPSSPSRYTR